ncbi:MAG: TRAP transporter small permease [Deltaproteobacteria bacterium]|nr:MAG: TRAP transporter small permease [Deltaproteobacteria bacterium]
MKSTFLQKLAEAITTVSMWVFRGSNVIAIGLMLIVFIDVFFRRLAVSVTGAMDLIEVFFCILCFLSFSYTWVKRDHINVEILLERLPPVAQKTIRLVSAGIGTILFTSLCYGSLVLAYGSFKFGDVTVDLGFPRGIPQAIMSIGAFLFLLQCIISILYELGIISKPKLYGQN